MSFTISVDTGGTFTDVIVRDASGKQTIGKALTTHGRVFGGLSESIKAAAADLGLGFEQLLADTTLFIYGTTRATNAIVTRNVAKTAFLTTEGFPDILVLKEGGKLDGYDFTNKSDQGPAKARWIRGPTGRIRRAGDRAGEPRHAIGYPGTAAGRGARPVFEERLRSFDDA